jgi:hypothetical protein
LSDIIHRDVRVLIFTRAKKSVGAAGHGNFPVLAYIVIPWFYKNACSKASDRSENLGLGGAQGESSKPVREPSFYAINCSFIQERYLKIVILDIVLTLS